LHAFHYGPELFVLRAGLRFLDMVDGGFFDGVIIFRVAKDFVAQFADTANIKARARFNRGRGAENDHPAIEPP
jgi:cyclophilin family peptidyl-prolyl cis-trans isomerase